MIAMLKHCWFTSHRCTHISFNACKWRSEYSWVHLWMPKVREQEADWCISIWSDTDSKVSMSPGKRGGLVDTHTHTHTHTRAQSHTHTHTHTCTVTHTHVHSHTHNSRLIFILIADAWDGTHTHTHTHAHKHTCTDKTHLMLRSAEHVWSVR